MTAPAPDASNNSDPSQNSEPTHDPAKGRFIVMQAMRLGGVLMVIGAVLILSGRVSGPPALAYGLLLFGAIEFFAMPYLLAKRWKTPTE